MIVKSKRSRALFRGRRVFSVQQHPKSSDEKDFKVGNFGEMTSIKDAVPTALEEPVELITQDHLEQLGLHENTTVSNAPDDFPIPELFTSLPPIKDPLITATSRSQDETAEHCLEFHANTSRSSFDLNSQGIPRLNREDHVHYLEGAIQKAKFLGYDAVRPWIIYWCLTGLTVLGEDLAQWRDRVLETCIPMQNPSGGFGGGPGQTSHAAPSYAVVLSLAMVGGNEVLESIDRRAL